MNGWEVIPEKPETALQWYDHSTVTQDLDVTMEDYNPAAMDIDQIQVRLAGKTMTLAEARRVKLGIQMAKRTGGALPGLSALTNNQCG